MTNYRHFTTGSPLASPLGRGLGCVLSSPAARIPAPALFPALIPTLFLALFLAFTGCSDDRLLSGDDTPPTPGADADAAALVGQPIAIGAVALSTEADAQTRAVETDFPKDGTTMTVFMAVPGEGENGNALYQRANYIARGTGTAATWEPAPGYEPLRWVAADKGHCFSAFSPAYDSTAAQPFFTPLDALPRTNGPGVELPAGMAYTFTLPATFTAEEYARLEQVRITGGILFGIKPAPGAAVSLRLYHAFVKVEITSASPVAVMPGMPFTGVFCTGQGSVMPLDYDKLEIWTDPDNVLPPGIIPTEDFSPDRVDLQTVTAWSPSPDTHLGLMIPLSMFPNRPTYSFRFVTAKEYSYDQWTTYNYQPGTHLHLSDGTLNSRHILHLDGSPEAYAEVMMYLRK